MKVIEVKPNLLRRVARIHYSPSNTGLNSLNAINDLYFYIYFDPFSGLFFSGSVRHVYKYAYSNSFEKMRDYVVSQANSLFITEAGFTELFGNEALSGAKEGEIPLSTLSASSGKSPNAVLSMLGKSALFWEKRKENNEELLKFTFSYPQITFMEA